MAVSVGSARHRGVAVMCSLAVVVGIAGVVPPAAASEPSAGARAPAAASSPAPAPARRVLILVVPGLAWRDLRDNDLPNLRRFTGHAGIANLSSRAPKLRSDLASGYMTLGAGNKAVDVGPTDDGSGLEPDGAAFDVAEAVGSDRAGPVFTRRTGRPAASGLVHLGIGETVGANRDSVFGAEVGALGDALGAAGFNRAVIANGDGSDTATADSPSTRRHRDAVAALMGRDGTVPAGEVGNELLTLDAAAPFGVRLDQDRVAMSFAEQWRDKSVVLVEASDLVRADAYRGRDAEARPRGATGCAARRGRSSSAAC